MGTCSQCTHAPMPVSTLGCSIHSPIFLFLLELLLLAVVLFLPDLPRFVGGQAVEGETTGVLLASAD